MFTSIVWSNFLTRQLPKRGVGPIDGCVVDDQIRRPVFGQYLFRPACDGGIVRHIDRGEIMRGNSFLISAMDLVERPQATT